MKITTHLPQEGKVFSMNDISLSKLDNHYHEQKSTCQETKVFCRNDTSLSTLDNHYHEHYHKPVTGEEGLLQG